MIATDIAHCMGRYIHQHGEFGTILHSECLDCQRRQATHYEAMPMPEFDEKCPAKETKELK